MEDAAQREDPKVMMDRIGGLEWTTLSERAKEFVRSLEGAEVLQGMTKARRRQLIRQYDDEAGYLTKNAQELENFLDDYGLTRSQMRQVVRRLISRNRSGASPGGLTGVGI